jgi:hypothetical protein
MERADLDKQIEALNSMVKSYGFDSSILTSKTAVHSGKDKEGADVPAGMYRLDMPDSTTKDVPATDFDAAHKALDQYRALLQQRGQPEQPAASPAPAATAQTQAPITATNDKGEKVMWDGQNWVPVK